MARPRARAAPTSRGSAQVPPASGMRPMRAKGLQEAGAARGVHQVAGQRDVGAGAGGDAVDGADYRFLQRRDELDQRIVGLLQPTAGIEARSVGGPADLGQVLAGREGPAGAGQHHHPALRIGARRLQSGTQLGMHAEREGIELVGPVERQLRDAAFLRNQDRLAAHVQVLLDFGRHTGTFSLPTAACHRGWADRPRRLGMAGPVVYSAAATEHGAILREYPAVQMLVSGPLETRHGTAAGQDQEEDTGRAAISGAEHA